MHLKEHEVTSLSDDRIDQYARYATRDLDDNCRIISKIIGFVLFASLFGLIILWVFIWNLIGGPAWLYGILALTSMGILVGKGTDWADRTWLNPASSKNDGLSRPEKEKHILAAIQAEKEKKAIEAKKKERAWRLLLIGAACVAAVFAMFALSNPTTGQFRPFLRDELRGESSPNLDGIIQRAILSEDDWDASLTIKRANLFVCSLYGVHSNGRSRKYLGVMGNFFEISREATQ